MRKLKILFFLPSLRISRPTLGKWFQRYQEQGEAGLSMQSGRPNHAPDHKVFQKQGQLILGR